MEATGQSPPQEPTDTHMSELEWITLREELKAEHGMKRGHGDSKFGNLRSVILPLGKYPFKYEYDECEYHHYGASHNG